MSFSLGRCVPRWSIIPSFMFSSNIQSDFRVSLEEYENTGITAEDTRKRFYQSNSVTSNARSSIEFCAR